jgi:hypothetical protein
MMEQCNIKGLQLAKIAKKILDPSKYKDAVVRKHAKSHLNKEVFDNSHDHDFTN